MHERIVLGCSWPAIALSTGARLHRMEQPPSTQMVAPVTKSEARDAKKTAVPAHSSGLPKRPAGVRVMISWYNNAGGDPEAAVVTGAVKSVSIHPGAIAFT